MSGPGSEPVQAPARRAWWRRRATADVALIWAALVVASGLGFGARLLLGRSLGTAGFGAFATGLAAVLLISRGGVFGVHVLLLEVHGEEGPAARRWYRPAAAVMVGATLVSMGAGAVWAVTALGSVEREVFFYLVPLVVVQAVSDLLGARYQIRDRHAALAVSRALPAAARFAPAAVAAAASWGVLATAQAFTVTALAVAVVSVAALAGWARPSAHAPRARDVVGRAWPYAVSTVMFVVYFQIDILLIEALEGAAEAGLYAAAVTIVSFVYLVPSAVYQGYLRRRIHYWAAHDRTALRAAHARGGRLMLRLGVLAAAAVALIGPIALRAGFGPDFAAATPALLVLALTIPIRFWSSSHRAVMSTRDTKTRMTFTNGLTAALNAGLNLAMIPWLGIIGAAITTVASEALLSALIVGPARRFVDTPGPGPLLGGGVD